MIKASRTEDHARSVSLNGVAGTGTASPNPKRLPYKVRQVKQGNNVLNPQTRYGLEVSLPQFVYSVGRE